MKKINDSPTMTEKDSSGSSLRLLAALLLLASGCGESTDSLKHVETKHVESMLLQEDESKLDKRAADFVARHKDLKELIKDAVGEGLTSQLNDDNLCMFVSPSSSSGASKYSFRTTNGIREFALIADFLAAAKIEFDRKVIREVVFVFTKNGPSDCIMLAMRELAESNGLRVSNKIYTNME